MFWQTNTLTFETAQRSTLTLPVHKHDIMAAEGATGTRDRLQVFERDERMFFVYRKLNVFCLRKPSGPYPEI